MCEQGPPLLVPEYDVCKTIASKNNIPLREVYLLPFQIAIEKSTPWTIMAAYNRVNGVYACSHDELLNQVLKKEWGFEGLVISDWFAAKETVDNALGGLDLEMPGPSKVWSGALRDAVSEGLVPGPSVIVAPPLPGSMCD